METNDLIEMPSEGRTILFNVHTKEIAIKQLEKVKEILYSLYGEEDGYERYVFTCEALSGFFKNKKRKELAKDSDNKSGDPYAELAGKTFAIAYADNVYNDEERTLTTLDKFLEANFPCINGLHVLPERLMCHDNIWAQDFFSELEPKHAKSLLELLQKHKVIDKNRRLAPGYTREWQNTEALVKEKFGEKACSAVCSLIDRTAGYHFNDGGFSQIDRSQIDPRFGTQEDLRRLADKYAFMLDFVVNHLDIDNPVLEAYRRGEDKGDAFLIVSPQEYENIKSSGEIEKTFRPRPFPLYTGMRKYPGGKPGAKLPDQVNDQNTAFAKAGLDELDAGLAAFLSIYFKVQNDQGLSSYDLEIFSNFLNWLSGKQISCDEIFTDSMIQSGQKIFKAKPGADMNSFLGLLGIDRKYGDIFKENENEIWGEQFYVYTTFSESQCDLYPKTFAGYKLVINDLMHLLGSGDLTMLRLDAIKYLWKVPGGKNFDTPQGNALVELTRIIMNLASPRTLPLDEINSPDTTVYSMFKDTGGFAYLFGEVNATVAAFNMENTGPLERFISTMNKHCPSNLLLFVMLSTHDGRSVQGVGVQLEQGHLTYKEYTDYLCKPISENGGREKFRSVAKFKIPEQTFRKACAELGIGDKYDRVCAKIFYTGDDELTLKDCSGNARDNFVQAMAAELNLDENQCAGIPAIKYITNWMFDGVTHYELCSTSRSAFSKTDLSGNILLPRAQADRLACAQLYVLTLGQVVPAIYLNDLLGLNNDLDGYSVSGRPRDLNRKKTYLPSWKPKGDEAEFFSSYKKSINRIISTRNNDKAFYPGSMAFEFKAIDSSVFLNHPFHKNDHSLILGNILNKKVNITIKTGALKSLSSHDRLWEDLLSGQILEEKNGCINLSLPPFHQCWLKQKIRNNDRQ